jgi:hypothetical protein
VSDVVANTAAEEIEKEKNEKDAMKSHWPTSAHWPAQAENERARTLSHYLHTPKKARDIKAKP